MASPTQEDMINAFNALFSAVNAHNQEFSASKSTASALLGFLAIAMTEGEDATQGSAMSAELREAAILNQGDEALARSIDHVLNEWVLDEIGVTAVPTEVSLPSAHNSGPMAIRLSSGAKLAAFLTGIETETVSSDSLSMLRNNVEFLLKEATQRVEAIVRAEWKLQHSTDPEGRPHMRGSTYELVSDEQQHLDETLNFASLLSAGMRNIGLVDSPVQRRLLEIASYNGLMILPEFLALEDSGIFRGVASKTFSPSEWHLDATSGHLVKRWGDVLRAIERSSSNPMAGELVEKGISSARAHLEFSEKDWSRLKQSGERPEAYGEGFEEVFQSVGVYIDMLDSGNGSRGIETRDL